MRPLLTRVPKIKDPNGTLELTCYSLIDGCMNRTLTREEVVDTLLRMFGAAVRDELPMVKR